MNDTVKILDNKSGAAIIEEAVLLKVSVNRDSEVMQHPLENGTSIVDHRVIKPLELNMQVMAGCNARKAVYDKFKALFIKAELVTVQLRHDVYKDMLIQAMPHEESANMVGAVAIAVKLKQVIIVQSRYVKSPKKSAQKKTVAQGVKQPVKPEGSVLSGSSPKTDALKKLILK